MKIRINTDIVIVFFYVLLIFQSPLTLHTGGLLRMLINNADELLSIVLFLYAVLNSKFDKIQMTIITLQLLFISLGTVSTILNVIQPISADIQDIVNCSKFSLVVVGIISLYKNKDVDGLLDTLKKTSSIIVFILFVLAVLDYIFKFSFFQHSIKRFGIYSLQLFYYHPALVAQIMVLFIGILSYGKKRKYDNIYIFFSLLMLCLTFRTKAIAFAFIYLIIKNYRLLMRRPLLRVISAVVAIYSVYLIVSESFFIYYGNLDDSVRGILTKDSFQLANQYFPFGTGFATFGTSAASSYYSPVYVKLGYTGIYGLGYVHKNFATDTFWPAVIAEFGYFGLSIFLMLIIYLIRKMFVMYKSSAKTAILYATLLIYLLVCSTSGTSFFNPVAVLYGMIMGLCLCEIQIANNSNIPPT